MTATSLDVTAGTRTGRIFVLVARAEALSWAGLLIAMFLKYVVQDDPHAGLQGGVPIMGAVHGAMFVIYVVTTIVTAVKLRWSIPVALVALGAAVPPFFTWWFESAARKRGLLDAPLRD